MPGCRRWLRGEERAVSRMGDAALGGARARPSGAMDERTRRGLRHHRAGPRQRHAGATRAGCGRTLSGTGCRHCRQSRRVSVVRRAGQFHQRAGECHRQRLRHSGDLHGCAGRVHQHRADRRLSWRRQAGSELHDRAPDRRSRAACGFDAIELRRRNLVREFPYRKALGTVIDCGRFADNLDDAILPRTMRGSRRAGRGRNSAPGCAASA